MPVDDVTVAVDVLLLRHVPPVITLLRVEVPPRHIDAVPAMGATVETVTVVSDVQPVPML